MLKDIYECKTEQEVDEKVAQLRKNGTDLFDIYVFRYWGKDHKYHRNIAVKIEN